MTERANRRLWSWHARTLATWIASSIQVDPKEMEQPLSEMARLSVYLDADEKAELDWATSRRERADESSGWKPGDPAIVREPPPGSAEALLGMMRGRV